MSASPAAVVVDEAARRHRLVRSLCHDCRTPLTVIAEFASLARDDIDADQAAETAEFLDLIGARVAEIEQLLGDFEYLHRKSGENGANDHIGIVPLVGGLKQRIDLAAASCGLGIVLDLGDRVPDADCAAADAGRALMALVWHLCRLQAGEAPLCIGAAPLADGTALRLIVSRGRPPLDLFRSAGFGGAAPRALASHEDGLAFRLRLVAELVARNGGALETVGDGDPPVYAIRLPAADTPQAEPPWRRRAPHNDKTKENRRDAGPEPEAIA